MKLFERFPLFGRIPARKRAAEPVQSALKPTVCGVLRRSSPYLSIGFALTLNQFKGVSVHLLRRGQSCSMRGFCHFQGLAMANLRLFQGSSTGGLGLQQGSPSLPMGDDERGGYSRKGTQGCDTGQVHSRP
ncbi:hypothetical protein [Streptomyces sp. HUAS TT7]|uniref:hypothetical protein n=1 Tax=Streptomyces sp. HUAS TT7 TaxID=3447507 RepID=UPI003F6559D4